ncbi:hypothetical protein GGR56DRAFT_326826 [Xylariaceae sp. FL0804]|nr:hypothetical protein GGR56DRAFT_326826 [Xylariaceae sp. FL0804]
MKGRVYALALASLFSHTNIYTQTHTHTYTHPRQHTFVQSGHFAPDLLLCGVWQSSRLSAQFAPLPISPSSAADCGRPWYNKGMSTSFLGGLFNPNIAFRGIFDGHDARVPQSMPRPLTRREGGGGKDKNERKRRKKSHASPSKEESRQAGSQAVRQVGKWAV